MNGQPALPPLVLKGTIQQFLIYSQSFATIATINFRTFYHSQKKPKAINGHFPFSPKPHTHAHTLPF